MKLKHLICIVVLMVLVGTASATLFYTNGGASDLTGGADFSKNLTTTTSTPAISQYSFAKSPAIEESYLWTQTGSPNNADWETGGFTVLVNVTALQTTTDLNLNVQVDRVFANGTVRESSATSTEQQLSSTGIKTFTIASKDWTAGTASDRLRLRYIFRNTKNVARTADISFENGDSYVNGSVSYAQAPVAPVASFTLSKNFLRIPNSVTATDTSTNTPTSWQWSWGDGTANSTTQNPSHQYLKRGKWDIVLTATNAGGSGTTGATSVKVVGYENYY